MSAYVLDYSAGWPAPAAVIDAGYVGVVRYIGTPGRSKNLTRVEAQQMHSAGVPVALVYETSAGWALGGAQVGADAARAALADAEVCGVQVRCVYLAVDVDVTDAQQMQAVQRTLDGAAGVLGRDRTGVYGEADVIDACVPVHAAYGWQTRAWSGGRVSGRAAILQQIGYVDVGGVQCDRSTVLANDWGQWPYKGDDMSDEQYQALTKQISDLYRLLSVGDARDDAPGGDPGGHPWNLERLRTDVGAMRTALTGQLNAQAQAITALSTLVAAGGNAELTVEDVEAAVAKSIRENLVHVEVSVDGQLPDPPAA